MRVNDYQLFINLKIILVRFEYPKNIAMVLTKYIGVNLHIQMRLLTDADSHIYLLKVETDVSI